MTSPRYRPRDFVLPDFRGEFGKNNNIMWSKMHECDDEDLWVAARLQHRVALRICDEVYSRGMTLKEYAALAGVTYQRLSQVMRGDVVMRFEDMAVAQRVLGVSFLA